jgi:hypothetical protein
MAFLHLFLSSELAGSRAAEPDVQGADACLVFDNLGDSAQFLHRALDNHIAS